MRKFVTVLAAASALMLAACDQDPPSPPDPNGPVVVDDECPRADNEPCR